MEQKNWQKIKVSNVVSVVIVLFCLLYPLALLFVEVPQTNKDIFNFLIGAIFGTGFGGAIYYLFNFKKKDDQPKQP